MKIAINNPCHENWDAMTPNEKGAFCLACQKTVVDFSEKTTEEIKSFFSSISKTEKVCGRFKEEQLTELTFDEFFSRFRSWLLPKKLAVVMLFVLGFSLVSCKSTKPEPLMGKVAYTANAVDVSEKPVAESEYMTMGEPAIIETSTVTPKPKKQPDDVKFRTVEEVYMKGDVLFEPDTIKKMKCTPKDSIVPEKHIMGMIKKLE